MDYYVFPVISLLAFFLKGITGTGTTVVIIAIGSLFIDPKLTVVLASFINIFGGLSMLKVDPIPLANRYWIPISVLMVAGSVVGAGILNMISNQLFQMVLGVVFLITALWFLFRPLPHRKNYELPVEAGAADLCIGAIAGFCGGFIGINAPPLVLYFSRKLDKRQMRRLLVLIFIPAAIAQTATFAANGLLSKQVVVWGLLMLPSLPVGVWLGNRTFYHVSETRFRRILGVFLVFVSIRLILKGMASTVLF